MTTERELAQAFAPCTLDGLAEEWDKLNREIAAIRKERDSIAVILLEASAKDHNGADEMWRKGSIIGDEVKVQAVWHLVDGNPITWRPRLEYCNDK